MPQSVQNDAIFDSFVDQFLHDAPTITPLLEKLLDAESFESSVNALFRLFHNHKAIAGFFKLKDILYVAQKSEAILDTIRQKKTTPCSEALKWLNDANDQMLLWAQDFELHPHKLSSLNPVLFNSVQTRTLRTPINESLRQLHLLYIDDQEEDALRYQSVFKKVFKKVSFAKNLHDALKHASVDLIMISDSLIDAQTLYKFFNADKKFTPLIALLARNDQKQRAKLSHYGIHYQLVRPLAKDELSKILASVVKSYFSRQKVLISNEKIKAFIEQLDPLSDTVITVQEICDDPERSIKELIQVVKKDPVMTGNLLHATKSPMFALKQIKSIDQAISTFGKRTVKALVLGGLSKEFEPHNLSMYGINEKQFLEIAYMRMQLMDVWYQKVNPEMAHKLTIAALLGNLGQVLIAKEVLKEGYEKVFYEVVKARGAAYAEERFFQTTTEAVSAQMMFHWKMSTELIDAIAYSDAPMDAIKTIRPFAVATHIVYRLIPLTKTEVGEISTPIKKLMLQNGLDYALLEEAVHYISNLQES